MPNFPDETGLTDATWERVRAAMAEVNKQRHAINAASLKLEDATRELGYLLWPRTDPSKKSTGSGDLER